MNNRRLQPDLTLQTWDIQDLSSCQADSTGKLIRKSDSSKQLTSAQTSTALDLRSLSLKETAHLRAAYYWLNCYTPHSTESPSERIKGFLEAAHFLEQLQAWDLLSEIIVCTPDASSAITLHKQLEVWGLLRERIQLFQPLIGKISPELDFLCLNGLGESFSYLCQYADAIASYKQNLKLSKDTGNIWGQLTTLEGLGFCHLYWGRYEEGKEYFEKAIWLIEKVQPSSNQSRDIALTYSRSLAGLGYIMYFLRQFSKGIHYGQKSLQLAQSRHDIHSQWMALGALAICYSQQGKHTKASRCIQQRLTLKHHGISAHDQLTALIDLGATYCYQLKFTEAIKCLEEVIAKSKVLGSVRGRCQASMLLGFIYCWQNKAKLSLEKSQHSLQLAQQFDYSHFESQSYSQLSYVYSGLGKCEQAITLAYQALETSEHISSQPVFYNACGLMALGLAQIQNRQILSGIRSILESLLLLPPCSATDGQIILALLLKRISQWFKIKDWKIKQSNMIKPN
ncbi:tetratricopeptide repeat protein [Acaryochloris sp. IP29b_bin.137]|uniref:tetratricopeptide repeat protein n=1 Tax=Acaryochloris sp. IP29b_bin.137 TaxID=2969217 RepID=UPI00260BB0B9|nr:tetratricopeptide repeat protein [Acaryochloris sp. IP29b_bin.137]